MMNNNDRLTRSLSSFSMLGNIGVRRGRVYRAFVGRAERLLSNKQSGAQNAKSRGKKMSCK
jgi:hypothetical protein